MFTLSGIKKGGTECRRLRDDDDDEEEEELFSDDDVGGGVEEEELLRRPVTSVSALGRGPDHGDLWARASDGGKPLAAFLTSVSVLMMPEREGGKIAVTSVSVLKPALP